MAKRIRPPTASRITREPTTAYARRQRTEGGDDDEDGMVKPPKETAAGSGPTKGPAAAAGAATVGAMADAPAGPGPAPAPAPAPVAPADAQTVVAPAAAPVAPASAATVIEPAVAEPGLAAHAAMAAAKFPLMPDPTEIPPGNPDDAADPPGRVPPGDSRSLRRGGDFVLVYRVANIVVSRFGPVGKRGQFRVVEYPTTSYAANAYARECSRWVSEGFSDYRDP